MIDKKVHIDLCLKLMMPFSTGTGLERVGVVGPNLDCWWAGLRAPGSSRTKYECCWAGLQATGSSGLM